MVQDSWLTAVACSEVGHWFRFTAERFDVAACRVVCHFLWDDSNEHDLGMYGQEFVAAGWFGWSFGGLERLATDGARRG